MIAIDKVTNVALILACCAVTADVVSRRVDRSRIDADVAGDVRQRAPNRPPEYKIGDAFPALPGYGTEPDARSLVLVVKDTCRFCTASMPFYQRLAAAIKERELPVRLVGVCPDSTASCDAYFRQHAVAVERVIGIAPGTLSVAGTPTVILVERGKVASVWTGQLPPKTEAEVLGALSQKTGTP